MRGHNKMRWRIILFVFVSMVMFGSIVKAKERDPLVRLLIKKGVITEQEVREMETEILREDSKAQIYGSQIKMEEKLGEIHDQRLANENPPHSPFSKGGRGDLKVGFSGENDDDEDREEIKSLKYEVRNLYHEIDRLKSKKSLLPEPVRTGFGELKIEGLLQLWYAHDETTGKGAGKADTFRLRRSEIMFRGKILPEVAWTVMIDPSKELGLNTDSIDQETRILQDFHVDLNYIPNHSLNVGQFKLPVTEEGSRSSAKLDTIQRSFIGRTFGDQRNIGIQLRGIWKYADYWLGIFNGEGQNQLDVNDYKDISGRIVLRPFKGLEIGMSGLTGKKGTELSDRNRLGGELKYEYNDLSFKGEYMKAKDSKLEREGWYAQVGYFTPFLHKLQGIFKYEEFEDDNNDEENDITVGLNYFIKQDHFKLQINYVHRNESKGDSDNDQVLTALQIAF
jgi:polyhydroxyalkanoate synthesis regulator phasin